MMEEDTEISLRKRLLNLDSNPEISIFTLKQSKSIDLLYSTSNNHFTDSMNGDLQDDNGKDFSSITALQPDANVMSVDNSSDSELPCGLFNETLNENLELINDPVTANIMQDRKNLHTGHLNFNYSQCVDTSTFTLKDLNAIEIDLTSDTNDNSFTHLKDSSPKNVSPTRHKFHGSSPEKSPRIIHFEHVQNVDSESSSSDLDLPRGIFASKPLIERVKITKNPDLQIVSEVLPSHQTKVTAPPSPQKGRLPSKTDAKKLQTKLKAEEKARLKEEKRKEREAKRLEKNRAAQVRKAQQMSRKAFQPKECLKHLTIILDSALLTIPGLETAVVTICENLGSTCLVQSQQIPFVVSWRRSVIDCDVAAQGQTTPKDVDEDEIVVCLPLDHFVELVYGAKQKQRGELVEHFQTLQGYVENMRQTYLGCLVTLVVIGMENYFKKNKKSTSKKHRTDTIISRLDVEEALVNLQLRNLCNCQLVNSTEDLADIIRTFTKSVAEKPMKKDRLQSEFAFHNEKGGGVASDTQSLWKAQLEQFKNLSSDVSSAIVSLYPSPKSLMEAYKKCSGETECIKLLENIMVRRKAGVLETSRRVGKEMSRRIYLFMNTTDANLILK